MRKIICDRCGSDILKDAKIGRIAFTWLDERGHQLAAENPTANWDFCEACMSEILASVDKKSRKMRDAA